MTKRGSDMAGRSDTKVSKGQNDEVVRECFDVGFEGSNEDIWFLILNNKALQSSNSGRIGKRTFSTKK
jgi:hypothetical protein